MGNDHCMENLNQKVIILFATGRYIPRLVKTRSTGHRLTQVITGHLCTFNKNWHRTYADGHLEWEAPTHDTTWSSDHVVTWVHVTNLRLNISSSTMLPIMVIVFWDFLMFGQFFLLPKWNEASLLLIDMVNTNCLTSCWTTYNLGS